MDFRKKSVSVILILLLVGLVGIWQGDFQPSPTTFPEKPPDPTASAILGAEARQVWVMEAVDGDTIKIDSGETVRYIGIDTPETVDPRRPVGCFGKEASAENKRVVEGKTVYLVRDVSETDKYNRLLRYVYLKLEDGSFLFVNDYLVRQGFAKASTYPPDVKYAAQFSEAEKSAREKSLGLWQKCV